MNAEIDRNNGGGTVSASKALKAGEQAKYAAYSQLKGFDAIAGYEYEKAVLDKFFISEIKNERAGKEANVPGSILFFGPQGNGKTSFAKAFAQESEARVRNIPTNSTCSKGKERFKIFLDKLYNEAKLAEEHYQKGDTNQRTIILIDEFDNVAGKNSTIRKELEKFMQTCFDKYHCTVFATTNYPEKIAMNLKKENSAFPYRVALDPPTADTKARVLEFYTKGRDIEPIDIPAAVKKIEEKESSLDTLFCNAFLKKIALGAKNQEEIYKMIQKITNLNLRPKTLNRSENKQQYSNVGISHNLKNLDYSDINYKLDINKLPLDLSLFEVAVRDNLLSPAQYDNEQNLIFSPEHQRDLEIDKRRVRIITAPSLEEADRKFALEKLKDKVWCIENPKFALEKLLYASGLDKQGVRLRPDPDNDEMSRVMRIVRDNMIELAKEDMKKIDYINIYCKSALKPERRFNYVLFGDIPALILIANEHLIDRKETANPTKYSDLRAYANVRHSYPCYYISLSQEALEDVAARLEHYDYIKVASDVLKCISGKDTWYYAHGGLYGNLDNDSMVMYWEDWM